jgi:hypothetical protein
MLMQKLLIVMFLMVVMLNVDAHEVFDCFLVQQLHHCSVDPQVVD